MPDSFFKRGVGAAALLALCAAGLALPGCYSVGGDEESDCDRDSDCKSGEFCSDDDECESACRRYCSTATSCFELSQTEAQCRSGCESLIDQSAGCEGAMVVLARCWDNYASCNDAVLECAETFDAMYNACVPPCERAGDGVCDEASGLCARGSDTADCGNNTCTYRYDGECDEGTYCAAGTDSYDCALGG